MIIAKSHASAWDIFIVLIGAAFFIARRSIPDSSYLAVKFID